MTYVRRSARLLLSLIALALAAVSLAAVAVHESVGTPERAAATIGAVIDSEHGPDALGAAFVSMLKDIAGEDAQITASDEALAKAAGQAIAASRDAIIAAVQAAYTANLTGQAATIDISPVIAAIAAQLHAVDPGIPADLGSGGDGPGTITIAAQTDPPLAKANKALSYWWLGLLASALALAGVALLSPHGGWRRWRLTGILLGIVGVLWLVAGKVAPGKAIANIDDAAVKDLATQVSARLVSPLLTVGGGALVLGVALVALSTRSAPRAGAHSGAMSPSSITPPTIAGAPRPTAGSDDQSEPSA